MDLVGCLCGCLVPSTGRLKLKVGSLVLANGRAGELLLYDAGDPGMTYKVKFDDGKADWFKHSEVVADESGDAPAIDAEELQRKAQAANDELATLKAAQALRDQEEEARLAMAKQAGERAEQQRLLREQEEEDRKPLIAAQQRATLQKFEANLTDMRDLQRSGL